MTLPLKSMEIHQRLGDHKTLMNDFTFTRGFATRVAKSYHPARKALLDQQAWLKIIQPTRAH